MFMLSLHEIESGWAFEDTLWIFSETVKLLDGLEYGVCLSIYLSIYLW